MILGLILIFPTGLAWIEIGVAVELDSRLISTDRTPSRTKKGASLTLPRRGCPQIGLHAAYCVQTSRFISVLRSAGIFADS